MADPPWKAALVPKLLLPMPLKLQVVAMPKPQLWRLPALLPPRPLATVVLLPLLQEVNPNLSPDLDLNLDLTRPAILAPHHHVMGKHESRISTDMSGTGISELPFLSPLPFVVKYWRTDCRRAHDGKNYPTKEQLAGMTHVILSKSLIV